MPPSPSLRRSPASETAHKRGRSFESALPTKPKDDELALFSDMQKNERENFLLEPSEDFDESISKLRYFPDFKLGVNVATRESNDLLNADGDKNDYDWLLTPPETPLFRSLDDDEHQTIGQAPRGRAQSKPMSISRSSTMEKTQRSSRSSASPNRLSPSPRSSSSVAQPRTRPSTSASRCSPPPIVRPSTPSRRPSTPPAAKPLTPTRRSPSPASRRMSTGSGGPALSYGTRGTSPVKANRGTSSSPKLRGWQSNLTDFSSDAPPNLRTSLPDRPVSRSRGTSPSSVGGFDLTSRGRRQSMSPTPSRSVSSSHSNERDRFSSYSKASAASSCEDDVDSMQSVPIGYSSNQAVRKNLAVMKTRTIASSKKPSKNFSPSSAPKRSFDSALWLMDHRKAPQNMFRPLLSSVPATTLGAGKGNNVHRPMFSRNSSLTTSSNASSEHGASFAPYMDSNHDHHHLIGEWEAADVSDIHEEVFMFDKMDELNEDPSHEYCGSTTRSSTENSNKGVMKRGHCMESTRLEFGKEQIGGAIQTPPAATNDSGVGNGATATCRRCGRLFNIMDVDEDGDLCEECALRDGDFSADHNTGTLEETHQQDIQAENLKYFAASQPPAAQASMEGSTEASLGHQTRNNESAYLQKGHLRQLSVDKTESIFLERQMNNHAENSRPHNTGDSVLGTPNDMSFPESSGSKCQQTEPTYAMVQDILGHELANHENGTQQSLSESDGPSNALVSKTMINDKSHQPGSVARPGLKVDNTEGTGISILLLQKSSSKKWPVVEGRALAATNILCSEPYYTRDNSSAMKRSTVRDSSSASSSIDLGSSRQAEARFQHLISGRRGDFEKAQLSSTISGQSTASVSDMSISGSSAHLCTQSDANEEFSYPLDSTEYSVSKVMTSTEEHDVSCRDAMSTAIECSSAEQVVVNNDLSALSSDRLDQMTGDVVIQDHNTVRVSDRVMLSAQTCSLDIEGYSSIAQPSPVEGCILKTEDDATGVTRCSSAGIVEQPSDENNFENLQKQSDALQISSDADKLDNCCVSTISDEEVLVPPTESNIVELLNDTHGDSATPVEVPLKQMQRSFTLEEATDTILFCSSIIHDLAYKAATIGMEREQELELPEAPRPTVTIIGKSIPKEEDLPRMPQKRTPNRKVKRKRLEGETVIQSAEAEENTKGPVPVHSTSEVTRTSDSMKPPKLESKCNCTIM